MTALRLALLPIVLYLSVDFANPHVPGAVSFEVNDCVDGIRLERPRASAERPVMTPIMTSRAGDAPAGDKTPRRPIIAADLAVLEGDPLTAPLPDLVAQGCLMTMVDGRVVHDAPVLGS